MIVRHQGSEIELVTQPDHARLARRVMEQSHALRDHPRGGRILHAVGEHDNGWAELDAAPMVDAATGEILDFIHAPAAARQSVWPRGVERLAADPWAAALVAQHALTAYDRFRQDGEWRSFFDRMTELRDDFTARAEGRLDDLLADYHFVRLGDLISLSFCMGLSGEHQFGDYTITRSDDRITVKPWPFERETITMEVEARVIPARPFTSDADLGEALAGARTLVLTGAISG